LNIVRYITRRLIFSAILVLGVSAIIFTLVNAIGNPIELLMAEQPGMSQEAIQAMSAYYHLDQPALARYFAWLAHLASFDFGTSIVYNQPVGGILVSWGFETLKIQIPAILIALVAATFIGVTAATRQYSRIDFGVMTGALLGQSLPGFFVGILLILIFSYWLGVLPSYGAYSTRGLLWNSTIADGLWHMILPVVMLAFFNTATLTLLMRSNLVDVMRNDFIMAARASGLPERRVIWGHALRNAFIPVLPYLGVTETVFTWPGIGALYIAAIQKLDYPIIMGVSFVITVMLVLATLLTDIAYVLIDPRVRLD
jgi:ABC-type dipeptide/oligopeptide/nickel transport system permease component